MYNIKIQMKKTCRDLWLIPLDDWLCGSFEFPHTKDSENKLVSTKNKFNLVFTKYPEDLIDTKEKTSCPEVLSRCVDDILPYMYFTNSIDQISLNDLLSQKKGHFIVNNLNYKKESSAICTDIKMDLHVLEYVLIKTKNHFFENNPAERFSPKLHYIYFSNFYRADSMIKLIQAENNRPKQSRGNMMIIRDELLNYTWHPDRFFEWCLHIQEQRDIMERWNIESY